MTKYVFFLLVLLLPAWPAAAQNNPAPTPDLLQEPVPGTDVRWFIWGVPPDDVIKYEKVILFEQIGDALTFVDDINGIKTLISYEFYKNKLWRVSYDFQKQDYPNPQDVLNDYVSMEIMMDKRYGKAVTTDKIWRDDYYKDKENRWGLAVYNSDLELRTLWENDRTQAVMSLKAENYDYIFRIVHTSKAIAEEMKADELAHELKPPAAPPAQTPLTP